MDGKSAPRVQALGTPVFARLCALRLVASPPPPTATEATPTSQRMARRWELLCLRARACSRGVCFFAVGRFPLEASWERTETRNTRHTNAGARRVLQRTVPGLGLELQ